MQRLEVSGAIRLIYKSLGVKELNKKIRPNKTSRSRFWYLDGAAVII